MSSSEILTKKKKKKKSSSSSSSSSSHHHHHHHHKKKKRSSSEADNSVQVVVTKVAKQWQAWFENDKRRMLAVIVVVLCLVVLFTSRGKTGLQVAGRHRLKGSASGDDPYDKASYGDGDDGEEKAETEKPKKKKKEAGPSMAEFEEDLKAATGLVHKTETAVAADQYNVKLRPMVKRSSDDSIVCPDKGGGKYNKICSKAYVEYLFEIPKPDTYYVYVETVAPNINDNSLWIGAPELDSAEVATCPSTKAGPLVPHKHVSKKKWLCCPKYLDSNAKKGQGSFYCDCCISTIGPHGTDMGCILDLEVDSKPHWNMLPRALKVKSTSKPFPIRLYAREDGTAVTRIYLSTNPELKDI